MEPNERRLKITDDDLLRVERKLNSAMSEKLSTRAQTYTQDKIKSLYTFLDNAEDSKEPVLPSRPTPAKQKLAVDLLNQKEIEYVQGISSLKTRVQTLELELRDANETVEHLKKLYDCEREERHSDKLNLENHYKSIFESSKKQLEVIFFLTQGNSKKSAKND